MNGGAFVSEATNDLLQQGLNSLIILGAWTFGYIKITVCLMVFPQAWLLHLTGLLLVEEKVWLWGMAGVQVLSLLSALAPSD